MIIRRLCFVFGLVPLCAFASELLVKEPTESIADVEKVIMAKGKHELERYLAPSILVFSDANVECSFDKRRARKALCGSGVHSLFRLIYDTESLRFPEIQSRSLPNILKSKHLKIVTWNVKDDHDDAATSSTFIDYCDAAHKDGFRLYFKNIKNQWLITAVEFRERDRRWSPVCMSVFKG